MWYSEGHLHRIQLREEHSESLEDLMAELAGRVSILFTEHPNGLRLKYQSNTVVAFVWSPPWAAQQFRRADYKELDASFQALKGCAYAVPLAVHSNEEVPIGLVVGLSESAELYELFLTSMLA
jgi:hypothetical protein